MGNKKTSHDWHILLQNYIKIVNKSNQVIEIGASTINRTRQLAKYCQQLTGIEYYRKRLPKDSNNITYIRGDWQKLEHIKSNFFDILVSSHTIEHVKNDLSAINETYRVLKKHGVGLITTPNRQRLARLFIEIFTGKRKFPYWEHQREYSYQDLKEMLSMSKFKKYKIIPMAFGLHGGKIHFYLKKVPKIFSKYACFWLIKLEK